MPSMLQAACKDPSRTLCDVRVPRHVHVWLQATSHLVNGPYTAAARASRVAQRPLDWQVRECECACTLE